MNELPDLVARKIWKYKLDYVFKDIKTKNHKLIRKHTCHEEADNHNLQVFALNYNFLRIMSGMGGLSYQN